MNYQSKLTPRHLARKAIVYLRQSSLRQTHENLESQRLQYALADRARKLGFQEVDIIDSDLGASASIGAEQRPGFQRLISAVALGEVGMVLSREASRLSRTDKDWCHLLEVCQIFGTLIADEQQIYDLAVLDDQLILGIKGTLSVVELKVLEQRLLAGQEEKAKRGELAKRLPPGYVRDTCGTVVLDPDQRIQQAVAVVFRKFRELGSARQTYRYFQSERIELPVNEWRGGRTRIVWKLPALPFIREMLRNPFYAGVYFYGRRPLETILVGDRLKKRTGRERQPEECRVFLRDHHPGYIDWVTFEENRRLLRQNCLSLKGVEGRATVRTGYGLAVGLLRCTRCGRKLTVRYWGANGTSARYLCRGDFDRGGGYCLSLGGAFVDRCLSAELLRVISPMGLRASVEAIEQRSTQRNDQREMLARRVDQLDYERQRAFEQYNEVDPRNRLVAAELEKRWNVKLEEYESARRRVSEIDDGIVPLDPAQKARIVELGREFSNVWESAHCPMSLKKKIARTVIEEILVNVSDDGCSAQFVFHWKGGAHTETKLDKPASPVLRKTSLAALDIIRKMAVRYGDDQIASVLNQLGHSTGKGSRWTQSRVASARSRYGIAGRRRAAPGEEVLSLGQAARECGVSPNSLKKLARAGRLQYEQIVPQAPWEIRRADLYAEPVRGILEKLRSTGKLSLQEGAQSEEQQLLFKQNQTP